jgi:hypothetical protein
LDDGGSLQDVAILAGGVLAGLKWSSQHFEGEVATSDPWRDAIAHKDR